MMNPSDYYLRTINKDFDDVDIERGKTSAMEAVNILVNSYESSDARNRVQEQVLMMHQLSQGGPVMEKERRAGFVTQCLVLMRRSFLNMHRDLGYYWFRFAIYIILCLCLGSIFYRSGSAHDPIQARRSAIVFVIAFLTFMAIGGFPSFVEDMKIFTRERLNGHYGVSAFVIANTFSSIPFLMLISLVPGGIAYYLVGLQKGIDHFMYFVLMLFACMIMVESLMMIVASVVPDFLTGIVTGAGIQAVMILTSGFFCLPNDLPKLFWRYPMHYIAFHKYGNQGLYKNELKGLVLRKKDGRSSSTFTGDEVLRSFQVDTGYSKWIDLAIVAGMLILYRLIFYVIVKSKERVAPMIKSFFLNLRPVKQPTNAEAQ